MLLLDSYLDFLVNYKDTSVLGRLRRMYDYYTFPRVRFNDLIEVYQYDLYRMLNDFVYLYSRLDLFFKLSTYDEFTKKIFLDMKRVDITSEAKILNDYTTYYSLYIDDSFFGKMKVSWNDKDYEVINDGGFVPGRYWSKTSRHDGLVIDVAAGIVTSMNMILKKFWNVPEKELNYQSIYVLSLDMIEIKLSTTKLKLANNFTLDLDTQCQYLHINDHKFKEIIPATIQVEYDDKLYLANIKLAVTYINYRLDAYKTTYNPYVIDYVQDRQDKIVDIIHSMIKQLNNI